MKKFFAYLNRMKNIKRWQLMRVSMEENIMEHTSQVVILAHALALINNKIFGGDVDVNKTVLLAQYHEVGEVITGDLPTPIKYFNPEIQAAYKDLEANACARILNMLPDVLKEEYQKYVLPEDCRETVFVKYADKLAAYLKCIDELKVGNSEFKKAKSTIEKDLKSYKSKEIDYFLKEFAPAYELTLDELD